MLKCLMNRIKNKGNRRKPPVGPDSLNKKGKKTSKDKETVALFRAQLITKGEKKKSLHVACPFSPFLDKKKKKKKAPRNEKRVREEHTFSQGGWRKVVRKHAGWKNENPSKSQRLPLRKKVAFNGMRGEGIVMGWRKMNGEKEKLVEEKRDWANEVYNNPLLRRGKREEESKSQSSKANIQKIKGSITGVKERYTTPRKDPPPGETKGSTPHSPP